MPLTAPSSQKKGFEAGVYEAVCYSVIDIGTQENKFGTKHQVVIGWKFLEYTYEDGNNVSYHQTFTLSMNEKAKLRELLSGWCLQGVKNPEAFDLETLLGKPCKVILAPNANGTISAKSVIPSDNTDTPPIKTEFFSFGDYDGGDLPSVFTEDRNQWKRERIIASEEYTAIQDKLAENAPF
jgi:hypothetical protein